MTTLIAITGLGILCLLFEILNLRKAIVPFSIIGLLAVLGLTISEFGTTGSFYNNMIEVMARIRAKFKIAVGEEQAKDYSIVSTPEGTHKILLNRELIRFLN